MTTTLHFTLLILFLFLSPLLLTTSATSPPKHNNNLVHKSCVHASYPDICLRSLSSCGASAATPSDLAQVALKVTLARLHKASNFLTRLKANGGVRTNGPLNDCVDQIGDSVDELTKALSVLRHLRRRGGAEQYRWQMNNVETWVSAALSNEDTCLDGFEEVGGGVRSDVRRKIGNVARVTSNALYLINLLDKS